MLTASERVHAGRRARLEQEGAYQAEAEKPLPVS